MKLAFDQLSIRGLNQVQGHGNEEQGYQIRDQEDSSSIGVAHVGEPPHISKADSKSKAREPVLNLIGKLVVTFVFLWCFSRRNILRGEDSCGIFLNQLGFTFVHLDLTTKLFKTGMLKTRPAFKVNQANSNF